MLGEGGGDEAAKVYAAAVSVCKAMLIGGAERAAHLQPSLDVQCLCCTPPREATRAQAAAGERQSFYNEITHLKVVLKFEWGPKTRAIIDAPQPHQHDFSSNPRCLGVHDEPKFATLQ